MAHDIDDYDDDAVVKSGKKGKDMSESINTDRNVINVGGSEGGSRGGADAVMMAALLNGKNQDPGAYAAMLNNNGGMKELWPILLLFGLGDKFGGRNGRDGACCDEVSPAQAAILQTLLNGQSDMRAQIGETALETQNSFLSELSRLALGTQAGFANLGDKVTNSATVLATALGTVNQNVSEQGCQTRSVVLESKAEILERISRFEIDSVRHDRDRFERQVEIAALNSKVEVNQTVTNIAAANAEARANANSLQDLKHQIALLANVVAIGNQVARSTNDIVTVGGLTNATQSANPVNAK